MGWAAHMSAVVPLEKEFVGRAHAFTAIHANTATPAFVANCHASVTSLDAESLPLTVVDSYRAGEAWVCSPCSAYGDYAIEELERFSHSFALRPLHWLCAGLNHCLRAADFDRAVTLNNWLLSTNLYPSEGADRLSAWRDAAIAAYPHHALWLRSLNWRYNAPWLRAALTAGFELIPSRQVYLIDDVTSALRQHHNARMDLKLLGRTRFTRSRGNFSARDYRRMEQLYAMLYLDKYSRLNPHYTAAFLAQWHRAGLLELHAFRDEHEEVCAVVGTFSLESTMTAPIVGYDTGLPPSRGLYRLLMASVMEQAIVARARINFSAGASEFKRLRGATSELEYSAVYSRHLPARRRRAITAVRVLAERVGVPFMRKFQL